MLYISNEAKPKFWELYKENPAQFSGSDNVPEVARNVKVLKKLREKATRTVSKAEIVT